MCTHTGRGPVDQLRSVTKSKRLGVFWLGRGAPPRGTPSLFCLSVPIFIFPCGFGFIRTTVPIRFLVPPKSSLLALIMVDPINDKICTKLGELVVVWNDFEYDVQNCLFMLTHQSALIMIVELSSPALCHALRSIASFIDGKHAAFEWETDKSRDKNNPSNPISPHVEHFLTLYERLREYRNFYVHSAVSQKGYVSLRQTTAKSKMQHYYGAIDERQLDEIIEKIRTATTYTVKVAGECYQYSRLHWETQRNWDQYIPTWPEKPPLSRRLQKPRPGQSSG
jgi:hypothetical protein